MDRWGIDPSASHLNTARGEDALALAGGNTVWARSDR